MDELAVSTVIYLPPEEVYEFVVDFPRYANYSKYLTRVAQRGDGGPGTRYDLRFAWWKLTYTVRSEVTGVEPPERIDWRILKDLNATGRWRVERLPELPADAPDDADVASRVWMEVEFDPQSADSGSVDLPALVSFDWVLGKVKPLVVKEAERIVSRVVEDLEGRDRPIELVVHERPDAV